MLSANFVFSQTSLQDYADCPARFDLLYQKRVKYPAPEGEPLEEVEAHMERGAAFHALIHQHLIGVDESDIRETIADDELAAWWEAYLRTGVRGLPPMRTPEVTLSATIGGQRVIAKYDVLAYDGTGKLVIVDWKTSIRRSKREHLAGRLQTIVYRVLAVDGGAAITGKAVKPEDVTMIYWFANFPDDPEIFRYDAEQYAADRAMLTRLIEDITGRGEDDFPLTDDVRRCRFCQYRGLHDRGTVAGDFRDADDLENIAAEPTLPDFSLDQIAEIAF